MGDSGVELSFELLATNASLIVRVLLPGNVPYESEFVLSPAHVTSATACLLTHGCLEVSVTANGVTVARIIQPHQLPDFQHTATDE